MRVMEVKRHAIVYREAAAHPVAHETVILRAPCRLGVIVNAVGVRQQPESRDPPGWAVEGAQGLLEPAQRSGGGPAQYDALARGSAQDVIESVRAPHSEHAHH